MSHDEEDTGWTSTRMPEAAPRVDCFSPRGSPRQTNGKAERFIQTLLREWAYRRPYRTSRQRSRRLARFLRYYNHQRSHASLNRKPPASRIPVNNVLRPDT
ncbi:MAG TPA: integrase core domain-containing protein [Thermoanaerobaculia bacterium]|nr:integrase core domain-containing protein [Thermoanaerobaculia bacterium]